MGVAYTLGQSDARLIGALIREVEQSMETYLENAVCTSSKTKHLLADRLEWDSKEDKLVHRTLHFRHYLNVPTSHHRVALTRMVLSCHGLASERLAWASRSREAIPEAQRVCRACNSGFIEHAAHALFECTIVQESVTYNTLVGAAIAALALNIAHIPDKWSVFRALLQGRDVLGDLAAHAYYVQEFFRPLPWILPGSDTEMDMQDDLLNDLDIDLDTELYNDDYFEDD